MAFGLSTSWNALRSADAGKLLFEIKDLGFQEIELSFNLRAGLVNNIGALLKDCDLRVASVHNFCPIPDNLKVEEALPDCYSLAALDPEERRLAVKQTEKTIDTAARVGAAAIVLHIGRVEVPEHTRQLIQLYEGGLKGREEFQLLREGMISERRKFAPAFLKNALASLVELNLYAQEQGIYLGIENRFYYREIPSFEEIGIVLQEFNNTSVFYWHDTGHARVMENLGFVKPGQYLDFYGPRLLGFHLHDVQGCRDHLAPPKGELDFTALRPYLKDDVIKIIEAHEPATAEELRASRIFFEDLICRG